jgi:maleylpyruvate isomerase
MTPASPRITLYTFLPSQNAVRAEIALREKGLDYERVEVDLFNGEHRRPPLSEITPRGQVPTLVHACAEGDVVVYESIAIIRFLDDIHPDPPLMPPVSEPGRRARALTRIEEFQAKLDVKNIFGSVVFGRQSRDQLGKRVDDLRAELLRWNEYTRAGSFLAGEQFTLADIAVFPLLMHFEVLGYDFARNTPALASYIDRCEARPSVQATGWIECFRAFVDSRAPERVLAGLD